MVSKFSKILFIKIVSNNIGIKFLTKNIEKPRRRRNLSEFHFYEITNWIGLFNLPQLGLFVYSTDSWACLYTPPTAGPVCILHPQITKTFFYQLLQTKGPGPFTA